MQPVNITLKLSKSTKGTHVYEMLHEGRAMGSVYLSKLILPLDPPKEMTMELTVK